MSYKFCDIREKGFIKGKINTSENKIIEPKNVL